MKKMVKVASLLVAASATLLVATACSSDGADTDGAKSSSGSNADASKIPGLALEKSDLPAGYQALDVPKDQTKQFADSMSASAKSAKVTPATCKQASAYPSDFNADEVSTIAAMKTTSMLLETVTVAKEDIAKVRANSTGECSTMTIEITDGPAAGAKGTSTFTVLDGPKTAADETVVLQQKMTLKLQGTTTKSTMILGLAKVNGYLVAVQTSDGAAGSSPDLGAFNAFFTKAVQKVASKTS